MAARKKRRKKAAKRKTKGKKPLAVLIKGYHRLGRIIKSRGGKV